MTRMKVMLLATALMIAAAQSNDPFRTPRRNTGVRRNDNQRKPKPVVRELREFTVKGHTIMAYSRKDAITRLKLKKKNLGAMKTKEQIEAHRRTCEHFNTTLLGDGRTCCTADLRALPTWQDPGGDGMVYPCGDDCPFMKQFINEDKNEDIETNHSDGRA